MSKMKEKIMNLIKTKGYYMVLAIAVLAVGTVSYLTYRGTQQKAAETPLEREEPLDVEKVEDEIPDDRPQTPPAEEEPAPEAKPASYCPPLTGEVIGHYSPDRPVYSYTLKDWRTHAGIDIAAAPGEVVVCACAGVVDSAGADDLMGNVVVVRQIDGRISRYASLGEIQVQEGQVLEEGDPIGTVGRSMLLECGETEHLHYELWNEDQPVDPTFLLETDRK